MSELRRVALGDLCDIQIGKTPPRVDPRYWGDGHPWLSIADMSQGRDIVETRETITTAAVTERKCRLIRAGTLVLSFKLSLGRVGFVRRDMFTNEAIAALAIRDPRDVDPAWLYHALRSFDWRRVGERAVKGKTLNSHALKRLPLSLPPLPAQRRVAAMLDKADAVRLKRRESLRLLNEFLRSAFLEMFGDPVRNEKGWEVKRLGDVALVERGRFTPRPRNDPRYYGGPHPFIQTGDIARSDGVIRTWDQTLNDEGTKVSRQFPAGTIAIAIAANIADTAIVEFDFYCPDSVVGVVPNEKTLSPDYLESCLRFFKPALAARAPMTAQRNINLQVLRPLKVPVPPLLEQLRFHDVCGKVRDTIVQMERHAEETHQLFKSLARRAFRGET